VDTYNYFRGLAAPIFRVQEFFYPKDGGKSPLKHEYIYIRLHDITSQMTVSQESQISQNNMDHHHHGLIKLSDLEFKACITFPEVQGKLGD
jgi:hypothetical protein